jgi:hypothetical protein
MKQGRSRHLPHQPQTTVSTTDAVTNAEAQAQREYVEQLASRKIRGFRGTIDEHGEYLDDVYQSNASLTANIASDYRDRFLIELIQNAYDAHPLGTRNGRIEITLDMRGGETGTLFVANRGLPFSEENVKDLCDIGLSRKPLGESIGNKGLGFRSIVQITDTPRIYSQSAHACNESSFSGFCFRFGGPSDYAAFIDEPRHLELACRDLPIFHIPIWLDEQSDVVRTFAADGFSTVIELPLRDAAACDSVQRQIQELHEQTVPMLLFLDRVSSLSVRVVLETGHIDTELDFMRSEETHDAAGMKLARVELGEAGVFLVARRGVAEAKMKKSIMAAIAQKELNEHWEKWRGDGDVAVAVRLDAVVHSPRLYTFLPMGEQAAAPFSGHLHGSFFPSSNRKHLNARNQLNALLLTEATALTANAIHYLITDPSDRIANWLTREERATATVDLLCWIEVSSLETDEDFTAELAQSLTERFDANSFDEAPVVPCLLPGANDGVLTWQTPTCVRRWPEGTEVFSADVASQFAQDIEVRPIWPMLGHRLDTIDQYLSCHADNYLGAPRGDEKAHLVSLVAGKLCSERRLPKAKWLRYFTELPDFMGQDGDHLARLPVLLGDDGELHTAMAVKSSSGADDPKPRRRRAVEKAVFSPPDPRRVEIEDDLEVEPPKKLSRRFAFLSTALPWHTELSTVRGYLEEHRLVEEFDREAVLAHLSRTLQSERNKEVLRGGLRWAFQLWRQPRARGRAFRMQLQHRFRVPTLDGTYIEAGRAIFSAGWPTETAGELVQGFLDAAPSGLTDLEQLKKRRLAAPDHPAFRGRWIEDWVQFLSELGVSAGLKPAIREAKNKNFDAHRMSDFSFLQDYGIPPGFAELWRDDIAAQDRDLLRLPSSTFYVVNGKLSWIPGQADVEEFSSACKTLYATLIFGWLSSTSDLPDDIEVHHHFTRWADRRDWPSPVRAFLRSAQWFPIEDPGQSNSEPVGVRPSEVWLNVSDAERFVPFLRRPPLLLRRHLERNSEHLIQNLKEYAGLRIFDDPRSLPEQLDFLARQYVSEGFDKFFERRLINLYNRTWQQLSNLLSEGDQDFDPKIAPEKILVRKGQMIHLVPMFDQDGADGEIVYICDTDREGDASLLEASGRAYVELKEGDPQRIGELFEILYGERIRRLSRVTYELLADGNDIEGGDLTPILEVCPQLRAMLAIAMEALHGSDAQRLPSDRSTVLTRLERLTVKKASKLSFTIDGIDVTSGQDTNAFHFRLNNGEPVVVFSSSGEWSWDLLDRCMPAIGEAVGYRSLSPHLRLLVAHLRHEAPLIETQSQPFQDMERFAGYLQLSGTAMTAARATLSAGLERQAPWIKAVLHLVAGPQAVEMFDRESADMLKDAAGLEGILSKMVEDAPFTAGELVSVCRTALGSEDFREGLGLDFASFNESLSTLGLEPETHPNLHRSRLENFIRQKEVDITDCLRASYAQQLDKMQPAEDYSNLRDAFRGLEPDPAWLILFKEPPEDALEELVNIWLEEHGAPPLSGRIEDLDPLEEVRRHNQRLIQDFAQQSLPLVRAWCAKNMPAQPTPSFAMEDGADWIRHRLDDVGVLDFRKLDEHAAMGWLQVLGIWPANMAQSLDPRELGLSEDDLSAESVRAREASEARKREARSVPFNGRHLDPKEVNLLALSEELYRGLSPNMLGRSLGATSELADALSGANSSPRGAGGGSAQGGRSRAPEEKTELIGRLGELTVYHWLQKILPKQDINAAWLSGNATPITGRPGNDGVGYDFEVSYRNQIWQIEVKASLEDPQSFEMGETEVAAARVAARPRSGVQYKIAYVSHVSNLSETTIEMIPNPMSEEGARVLELRGEGIRYAFRRKQL